MMPIPKYETVEDSAVLMVRDAVMLACEADATLEDMIRTAEREGGYGPAA